MRLSGVRFSEQSRARGVLLGGDSGELLARDEADHCLVVRSLEPLVVKAGYVTVHHQLLELVHVSESPEAAHANSGSARLPVLVRRGDGRGSSTDAQDVVHTFLDPPPPLGLTSDVAVRTAWSNDVGSNSDRLPERLHRRAFEGKHAHHDARHCVDPGRCADRHHRQPAATSAGHHVLGQLRPDLGLRLPDRCALCVHHRGDPVVGARPHPGDEGKCRSLVREDAAPLPSNTSGHVDEPPAVVS